MPPGPAAMIQRLPNSDTVQPSLKRAAFTKAADTTERPQENFLCHVRRFARVSQHARNQAEHWPMIMSDQPIESRLRTTAELRHQRRFVVGPAQDPGRISHRRLFVPRQTPPDEFVSH